MSTEKKEHVVSFFDPAYQPVSVEEDELLSEVLDATNSPLLFGCRTGICGTCVIEVEGELPPADDDEKELLEIYAPGNPNARLACQIELTSSIRVRPLNFD
ncbi:MAG: (2Fe-2S)-binding protein [Pseudomonadales bacterium]|nr:(2Fe-2S)-binding protein [Pseudomonadales bacterium]